MHRLTLRLALVSLICAAVLLFAAAPVASAESLTRAALIEQLRANFPEQVCAAAPAVFYEPFGIDAGQCAKLMLLALNYCLEFSGASLPGEMPTQQDAEAVSNNIGKCAGGVYIAAMSLRAGQ